MLERTYPLARKALFRLEAERAHNWSLRALRAADRCGILQALAGEPPQSEEIRCMGLTFPNRLGLAAGLDKEGNSIDAFGRLGFGFIEIGTITPRPQAGNPTPRLFRLPEHEGGVQSFLGESAVGVPRLFYPLSEGTSSEAFE